MINNVNHKNMIVMWLFLKGVAEERGLKEKDINIFEMLELSYPENYHNALKYYTDPSQWSPLETYVQCYLKTKEITGDPNTFRNCGRSASKYKSIGNWKEIAKSISGPTAAINILPNITPDWNDTKIFELVQPAKFNPLERKVEAIIRYTFHPHIDPCDDYCSDPHILGLLEAIPTNWPRHLWRPWKTLPMGEVQQMLVQYDPIKLFNSQFFEHLKLDPRFDGNRLYIRHPVENRLSEIGMRVVLMSQELHGQEIYLGKYEPVKDTANYNATMGTLITKTINIDGEPICQEGTIMGAPYFLIKYSCEELALTQSLSGFKGIFKGRSILLQEHYKTNLILREQIEEKNRAYEKLSEYSDHLEDMVEARTSELRETQAKLLESEKRTLEHRITGGFAHEMRNALAGAQLEFKTTLNYKDQGKPSAEILKDSATTLLKNISLIHEKYNIPREEIATLLLPELKTIAEIADHLSESLSGVSKDLDRGLSITTQIRDYAKMSELKPGNAPIDIVPLLKSYGDRYRQDFERIGIRYAVEGVEKAIVKAEEIHLDSIFGNLIRNAKDALEEFETDRPKEICVRIDRKDDETGSFVTVEVSDNGPGIPEENLSEIFEPFFSTNPTSGTGLGLGIAKRLVQLYGGTIEVESEVGEGTKFTIDIPQKQPSVGT